jgi:hypothetical protein
MQIIWPPLDRHELGPVQLLLMPSGIASIRGQRFLLCHSAQTNSYALGVSGFSHKSKLAAASN